MSKNILEFKLVPGFEGIACTNTGIVFDALTLEPLKMYKANGRYLVRHKQYNDSVLSLHRLVALTWVENPDPLKNNVVNHIDGNPLNNKHTNLEWTTFSGNNYHAVNTGLRPDPIKCLIRDFNTGTVYTFPSVSQACEYMGLGKDTHYASLRFKQFGKLIKNRYEFRYEGDNEPWFYEGRTERITPARYKVVVTDGNGLNKEIFSNRSFLKEYQLYKSPYGKSMPSLALHAKELYPTLTFTVFDYYTKDMVKVKHRTKSYKHEIVCTKGNEVLKFDSMTKCAKSFKVSRALVKYRLKNGGTHEGWSFTIVKIGSSSQKCD